MNHRSTGSVHLIPVLRPPPKSSFSAAPLALFPPGQALTESHRGALLCSTAFLRLYKAPNLFPWTPFDTLLVQLVPIRRICAQTPESPLHHCCSLELIGDRRAPVVLLLNSLLQLVSPISWSNNPNPIDFYSHRRSTILGFSQLRPEHPFSSPTPVSTSIFQFLPLGPSVGPNGASEMTRSCPGCSGRVVAVFALGSGELLRGQSSSDHLGFSSQLR